MKTLSMTAALLALSLAACGDDSPVDNELDGSMNRPDGSALLDANLGDSAAPDSAAPDSAAPDASVYTPPASPTSFKLGFSSSQCFGTCPAFSVSIDQTGKVQFDGDWCTVKPGIFEKQVAAADARALYDGLLSAKYWSFGERYETFADGCGNVATDHFTERWSVEVDGHVKTLVHYQGCDGVAGLDKVDALAFAVRDKTATSAWIGMGQLTCRGEPLTLALSYKLGSGDKTLGLLKLGQSTTTPPSGWSLVDCAGTTTIASGGELTEPGRVVLLDGADKPITLPQGLGDVGSITIEQTGGVLTARGLRAQDDLPLSIVPATGC